MKHKATPAVKTANAKPFGMIFNPDFPDGTTAVIVCRCAESGLIPLGLLLPHQVYVKDFGKVPGLCLIPVRRSEYIFVNEPGMTTRRMSEAHNKREAGQK